MMHGQKNIKLFEYLSKICRENSSVIQIWRA